MSPTGLSLRLTLLTLLVLSAFARAGDLAWPVNGQTAISLNYDDALASQLDHALPALNAAGFKGSFYLTLSSPVVSERLPAWRAVAQQGHELGNHTLFHHCRASLPGRDWVQPQQDLDRRTPAALEAEILTANGYLHAIDGKTQRTFTPPCGDTQAGGEDFIARIAPHFLAIKGQEPPTIKAIWLAPSDLSGEALINLVQQHETEHQLINLTFHGVGGDYLAVSASAHAQLLAYLAAHPARYTVATYAALAQQFSTIPKPHKSLSAP